MLNTKTTGKYTIERDGPPATAADGLRLAIRAMNRTPNFNTGIPDPKRSGRELRSYDLLPMLEALVRTAGKQP
jgi:hypothetical protein